MKIKFIYKIHLLILGIIGSYIIVLLTSHYGAGISPDSVAYISVARHLSDGTGFVNYDGYFFVLQPPLYPLLLAAIKKIILIDPLIFVGYLNAIILFLIVYYSGLFLLRSLKSSLLAIIGVISILVSFVFIQIFLNALSEPLFILFVLLFLYYFDIYRENGNFISLLLFSAAAALACLTRYVGVIIILTGIVSIIVWRDRTVKEMYKHLIVFLSITILPIGLWVLRNYLLSGTFTGQRAESSYTLPENIILFFNTILKWYLPIEIKTQQLFVLILIFLIGIITVYFLIKKRGKELLRITLFCPTLIFTILYSAIIVISSTTTAFDKIGDRLLSPLFVPSIFIIFFFLDNILEWLTKHFNKKFITVLFICGIIFWLRYPVIRTIYNIQYNFEHSGWEYGSKAWKDNTVIDYLNIHRQFDSEYSFYSNAPEAVFILTNIEARWSPPKTLYNSPQLINANAGLKSVWKDKDKSCLVWFNNIDRKFLFTVKELQKSSNMVMIARLKDGEIYTVQKR
jgi:4-amino-4-deoxy-L-arabinose transferase-like glycosyltransferase